MSDVEPLYDLRLRTPRLELRLGGHDELVALGRVAEGGIHPPEEMPFAIAWSDGIGEPVKLAMNACLPVWRVDHARIGANPVK